MPGSCSSAAEVLEGVGEGAEATLPRKARSPSSMRAASRSDSRRSPPGPQLRHDLVGLVVLGAEAVDLGVADLRHGGRPAR